MNNQDFNAGNRLWADRILRENRTNSKPRSVSDDSHLKPKSFTAKVSEIPAPQIRSRLIHEFMRSQDAAASISKEFAFHSKSPANAFLIPQEFGWPIQGLDCGQGNRESPDGPKSTVTGMYNWDRHYKSASVDRETGNHNVGYITMVGESSHPIKRPMLRMKTHDMGFTPSKDLDLTPISIPGDFHLRKHELKFRVGKSDCCELPEPEDEVVDMESDQGRSIPTTEIRKIDRSLRLNVEKFKPFMNRIGRNRWYHPLTSNDVSAYGSTYVRTMHVTPFAKTQLLVSR